MDVATVTTTLTNLLGGELPHRLDATNSSGETLYRFGKAEDGVVLAVMTLGLLVLRQLTADFGTKPIARFFGIRKANKQQRFADAGWFFLYKFLVFFWGLSLCMRHDMSYPLEAIFANFPQDRFSFETKLYIMTQYAFYMHAIFLVVFLEARRKDALESFIHHIATLILLSMSRVVMLTNIAVTVMVLHELSDLFLYLAKVFNYIGYKRVTDFVFAIFALSFFIARLCIFPFMIYAWVVHSIGTDPNIVLWVYYGCTVLFSVLLCLHCFWFRTIFKMVLAAFSKGTVERDVRSDDDEAEVQKKHD